MKDRLGNSVDIGDIVRVVELCQEFLDLLPDDELPQVSAMLNNEFAIDGFPEEGKASVSISWEIEGNLTAHSGLYMLPHEFELVRKSSPAFAVR
ncbi:MAG: hypothetical protein V4582_15210 [Pseudomonadota bacterium]